MSQPKKNKTTVDIYGQQYVIVGPEATSHMRLVATLVDDKMREIAASNPSLDSTKLAVLTAVNAVHDHLVLKEKVERLEKELERERKE
ncbi:hypothetical protein GCM10008967_25310 [Bacillus carboniphilus]|uniref:Cell division protein ZapA n=1 Tax=Bacillus carboniphilus TaxID=86663 RepID=A0ABP3G286_9BACI